MKRLLTYILLFTLVAAQFSCDKQLSAPPANARVEGTAITNQQTAQIALNGAYYRFANVNNNNVTDWASHQVTSGMLSGMMGYGFGAMQEESNDMANGGYGSLLWSQSYLLLNAANGVIQGINAVADNAFIGNKKNELLSESRFLRAYAHFRLLIYFGEWYKPNSAYGTLLRDQLSTLGNIPKARSNVADSYKFILEDLDFAIANGPASNSNYYATKWAAMALRMRVLICRGQTNDYAEVINLGNTILQQGPYELESNLKDLFYVKGLNSKEVILGVKPQPNQEAFYYILSRAYYPAQSSLYVAKKAFKDLLQNDPRSSWMIGPATPYQAYSPNTYYFTKYIAYGGATSQLTETSYAIRLTEVYLLQAEAIIRSGGDLATAKDLIKTVMGKAGVTDFSAVDNATTVDQLLLQNYYEVCRNLTGEDAIEWLTLLRLPFDTVKQLKPTIINQFQYIYPVPLTEFESNPAFGDQNPGYSK
ncbi:RagB/SusD family nutrient uptake outer membrane protein [Pseudoflavitalea sp. X16]|uniref:RagB/SusD family nutrient uptake outer membrane protein n=1 Tax=Paraflavitalea devenefica TaxID=2716334 RepID=UPI00141E6022|nr:RagB/SusD family nutrient uptake outer membrane protein [Paraflavitalea devenefica]NII29340.1 RagB/SusD family nutrient uptake outer membrane protein [Paraflavitalea devenefica]